MPMRGEQSTHRPHKRQSSLARVAARHYCRHPPLYLITLQVLRPCADSSSSSQTAVCPQSLLLKEPSHLRNQEGMFGDQLVKLLRAAHGDHIVTGACTGNKGGQQGRSQEAPHIGTQALQAFLRLVEPNERSDEYGVIVCENESWVQSHGARREQLRLVGSACLPQPVA